MDKLETGQAGLIEDLAVLREDLTFVRETATRMEITHGQRLDGLSDGYKLHDIKLKDHSAALDRIEFKLEKLDTVQAVHTQKIQQAGKLGNLLEFPPSN
jgi:hypothetical protein